jgi:hypothetical protein
MINSHEMFFFYLNKYKHTRHTLFFEQQTKKRIATIEIISIYILFYIYKNSKKHK